MTFLHRYYFIPCYLSVSLCFLCNRGENEAAEVNTESLLIHQRSDDQVQQVTYTTHWQIRLNLMLKSHNTNFGPHSV